MIELIVLDVDGTLTDGKIIYTNSGDEIKNFDVKDGLAISTWTKQFGKKAAIITGRTSSIVEKEFKIYILNTCIKGHITKKKC